MGIVKPSGVLLVIYKILEGLFQMGIVLVCWLGENKTIEIHIVCFKMMETENNSRQ